MAKSIIEIDEKELKDLRLIRNYFGEHDVTMLEHFAYSFLDKLHMAEMTANVPQVCFSFLTD